MILYFAYGSNLDVAQMQLRCPGSTPVVPGRLLGYRLGFTRQSSGWGCGVADVVPRDSAEVWGLVYEVSADHLERLDRYEGYPHAYTRFLVTILAAARSLPDVWVYSVREKERFIAPTRAYLDILKRAGTQEVALLAYRQFFERRAIPVLAFRDPSVTLEGAMTAFIINPKPSVDEDSVLAEVARWLAAEGASGSRDEDDAFRVKWDALEADDRTILAALVAEGGRDIKEQSVRLRLIKHHGFETNRASRALSERRLSLSAANLVQLRHNIYDGDEISLHPSWEWYVRHAIGLALAPDGGA